MSWPFGSQTLEQGTCLYCGEISVPVLIVPSISSRVLGTRAAPAKKKSATKKKAATKKLGVCDLCSYALRHAWKRELGELVTATSPKIVTTYALFARLPEGKSEFDVSAYEILTRPSPSYGPDTMVLPSCEFFPFEGVAGAARKPRFREEKVAHHFGCVLNLITWDATLREIYLGYSGTGEFSNVLLAWAWGPVPGQQRIRGEWKTFAELLSKPTPEAGFYLGVKAAFEALLWRREVLSGEEAQGSATQDDLFPVSVVLSEGAVRCLGDDEDPKMLELFKASLSPVEAEVVRLVQDSRKFAAATPKAAPAFGSEGSTTRGSATRGSATWDAVPRGSATQGSATQGSAVQELAAQGSATQGPTDQGPTDQDGDYDGSLEEGSQTLGSQTLRDPASIPPGYARIPR